MRYGGSNPPLCTISLVVSGECCGSKPGEQRKDVDCAGYYGIVGGCGLADDGAGQTAAADLGSIRIFCLPRHTWKAAFAVGL